MTWEYYHDQEADETIIYWSASEQGTVDGVIDHWRKGFPMGEAREVVGEAIQSAGTPDRIRMQYDFNYGFSELTEPY